MNGHAVYGIKMGQPADALHRRFARYTEAFRTGDMGVLLPGDGVDSYHRLNEMGTLKDLVEHQPLWSALVDAGQWKVNRYLGPTTDTMRKRGAYLQKLERESLSRIIMGEDSVDEFDDFVDQWMQSGGEDLLKEVNDWFESVQ
jgi:hypothetical protein